MAHGPYTMAHEPYIVAHGPCDKRQGQASRRNASRRKYPKACRKVLASRKLFACRKDAGGPLIAALPQAPTKNITVMQFTEHQRSQ